jgi:hypothetical protein
MHIQIEGVGFTSVNKSRLYKQGQQEIQAGRLKVAGSINAQRSKIFETVKSEFLGLRKQHKANNILKVEKNPKRKDAKDDIPDSVMLCMDAAKRYMLYDSTSDSNPLNVFEKNRAGFESASIGMRRMETGFKRVIRR